MIEPTDFLAMTADLREGYRNEVVTTVNDHDIHVSVMEVSYFWHFHPDSDETFIGIEGVLIIDFEEGAIELRAGQLLTIPAGVRHRTRPGGGARSINLTVEKANATTIRCDAPREG
ncbi:MULTISPECIES: cupin domain-containing protein [Paraburkholderia]|uniref:Cupin domain-containing protein n=1 Tax=Paraburkholderia unamae TaxID=219649 RepID=A0ACC6RCD5_9BURK